MAVESSAANGPESCCEGRRRFRVAWGGVVQAGMVKGWLVSETRRELFE